MIRKIATLCLGSLLFAGLAAAAEQYKLDPVHSHIGFSARHFGLSNVRGEFTEYSSEMMIDEADLTRSTIEITIQTASISTANEQRDGHLRSPDFLDVENHPQMRFKSTEIVKTAGGEYLVTGELTIRGVTEEVEIPVTLAGPLKDPMNNMRFGAEGTLTIDRHDFGVSWSRVLDSGGLVVGDEVRITFSIEAVRPLAEAPEGSQG